MNLSDLLIIGMATLYAAYALTKTHGAFGMFTWIREHLPLGGMTTCIVCAAFWFALLFVALWYTPFQPIVYPFAAAGMAVFAGQYTGMNQTPVD